MQRLQIQTHDKTEQNQSAAGSTASKSDLTEIK